MTRPLLAVALLLSCAACSKQDPGLASSAPAQVAGTSGKFESAKDNFSVTLPKDMQPINSNSPAAKEMMEAAAKANPQLADQISKVMANGTFALYAMDLAKAKKQTDFVDNMNVIHRTGGAAPPMTDATKDQIKNAFLAQLPNVKITTSEIVDLPVGKAVHLVSELPLRGAGGKNIISRSEGFYVGDSKQLFIVTYTSGDAARSAEFRQSMESFRIK